MFIFSFLLALVAPARRRPAAVGDELLDLARAVDVVRPDAPTPAASAPRVQVVADALGHTWAVDPRDRVAYILFDPDRAVVQQRTAEALTVLAERPALRLIAGGAR